VNICFFVFCNKIQLGVPKSRYRLLRHKRDKLRTQLVLFCVVLIVIVFIRYKRKDYRKGHEINSMQKRLLQNVELLEVEDSQSSSTTENAQANAASDRDESQKVCLFFSSSSPCS
jgi:hypothetical protein